jgi:hypothetical protein
MVDGWRQEGQELPGLCLILVRMPDCLSGRLRRVTILSPLGESSLDSPVKLVSIAYSVPYALPLPPIYAFPRTH